MVTLPPVGLIDGPLRQGGAVETGVSAVLVIDPRGPGDAAASPDVGGAELCPSRGDNPGAAATIPAPTGSGGPAVVAEQEAPPTSAAATRWPSASVAK